LAKPLGYVCAVRIDAGYIQGSVTNELTEENVHFLGRIKGNAVLDRLAAPHLHRPIGPPAPRRLREDRRVSASIRPSPGNIRNGWCWSWSIGPIPSPAS
jgi:hypothetical protein